MLLIGVTSALEVGTDTVKQFDEIFDNNGHVVCRFAVELGHAWWSFQNAHAQRLSALFSVGNAELELRAGLDAGGSCGEGGRVEENFLAVI